MNSAAGAGRSERQPYDTREDNPMTDARWPDRLETITLFVADLAATKRFYEDVFAVPLIFEDANSAVFRFGPMLVNLLDETRAPELVEPAPVGSAAAGAPFLLTINVDDLDAVLTELGDRGVRLENGPIERPWGVRTACFRDPAGFAWEVATPLTAG
jgi:catechol 2,3-dioxygenase-like lactoylglutathione lyase family enzyme